MLAKKSLLIAAPSSGSGKTLLTLALLRALKDRGFEIASAKAGPDYIDPGFHEIACGETSVNLDPWAMSKPRLQSLGLAQQGSHLLIESMMGLFDGAADGSGSGAELSKTLSAPVLLVVDAAKQSHSIAALVRGFRDHDADVNFAGVLLNKVGSSKHEAMLREALEKIDVPVLGAVPRLSDLQLPERHLGLVQAGETDGIEDFISKAAEIVANACDLKGIAGFFSDMAPVVGKTHVLPPLGQRIAIARDEAFSFCYAHLLHDWRAQGCELTFFSPLRNEAPSSSADSIYLPGGYPELHLEALSNANVFKSGMRSAVKRDALIYGECGGYMVLGNSIDDKDGCSHAMLGLLNLETSFAKRKLHLGYRRIKSEGFKVGNDLMAHEFHYTSAIREEGTPLFSAVDAKGVELGECGLRDGNIMGSYMHVIDRKHQ